MSVVHPSKKKKKRCQSKRSGRQYQSLPDFKLTLLVPFWYSQRIPAHVNPPLNHVARYVLHDKGLVGTCSFVNSKRPLSPEAIHIFGELSVDARASGPVVVAGG